MELHPSSFRRKVARRNRRPRIQETPAKSILSRLHTLSYRMSSATAGSFPTDSMLAAPRGLEAGVDANAIGVGLTRGAARRLEGSAHPSPTGRRRRGYGRAEAWSVRAAEHLRACRAAEPCVALRCAATVRAGAAPSCVAPWDTHRRGARLACPKAITVVLALAALTAGGADAPEAPEVEATSGDAVRVRGALLPVWIVGLAGAGNAAEGGICRLAVRTRWTVLIGLSAIVDEAPLTHTRIVTGAVREAVAARAGHDLTHPAHAHRAVWAALVGQAHGKILGRITDSPKVQSRELHAGLDRAPDTAALLLRKPRARGWDVLLLT